MCVYIYIYIHICRYLCISIIIIIIIDAHMYMCIYIYIYIYVYLLRHGNRKDVFLWFPSSTSCNVSFCMVCVVGFLFWFPSSQETFAMVSVVFVYGFRGGRKTICYGFRRWTFGGFCRRRRIQHLKMCRTIPRFFLCF